MFRDLFSDVISHIDPNYLSVASILHSPSPLLGAHLSLIHLSSDVTSNNIFSSLCSSLSPALHTTAPHICPSHATVSTASTGGLLENRFSPSFLGNKQTKGTEGRHSCLKRLQGPRGWQGESRTNV